MPILSGRHGTLLRSGRQAVAIFLACSRLRDGGGKSFSSKKYEKRARAGERQGGGFVRVLFSLCSFQYVPTVLSESLAQAKIFHI